MLATVLGKSTDWELEWERINAPSNINTLIKLAAKYSDNGANGLKELALRFFDAHQSAPGGLSLEVGTREGGGAWLMAKLLEHIYVERKDTPIPMLITVDPYGSKPYKAGPRVSAYDYGDQYYIASKQLLSPFNFHTHFLLRDVDFLDRVVGLPYWRLGQPYMFTNFSYVMLDGEHDTPSIEIAIEKLMPHMLSKSIIHIDNIKLDKRTRPMLEKYHATFVEYKEVDKAFIRCL